MISSSFSRSLERAAIRTSSGRGAIRKRNLRPCLAHALERRLLLSAWTVTSTADDGGAGTLRSVVANSSVGDVIQFDPNVFSPGGLHTITLTQGAPISILHNLTINGPGPDVASVSGGNLTLIFDIDAAATVTISGLTVTQGGFGHSFEEGGIFNFGNLSVSDCTLSDTATGAIWNEGTLSVTSSHFIDNSLSAIQSSTGDLSVASSDFSGNSDGAIYCEGIQQDGFASISDCTFSNNTALYGGAIGIRNFTATINRCTFVANSVRDYGGAVWVSGDATVDACTFIGNSAGLAGGGVNVDYGTAVVGYSTFERNSAAGGGAIGAAQNAEAASVSIFNDTFTGNAAVTGAALGLYASQRWTVTNCTVSGNAATTQGGGIENLYNEPFTLNNCIVVGNTVSGGGPSDIAGLVGGGFDLIGKGGSGGLVGGSNGNLVGIANPGLAPLGNYEGPTETMALLPGSPAYNAGSSSLAVNAEGGVLFSDQRGLPRLANGWVDIGAYEAAPPKPPVQLRAMAGADEATLDWLPGASLGPYSIYRSTTPGGEGSVPIAMGIPDPTFVDTGLVAGITYYYKVTAANAAGESASTFEVSAVPFAPPPINGTAGDDSLTLTQDADHLHVDWTMGTAGGQFPINDPDGQAINGNGGADSITLNFVNGNPLPNLLNLNGTFTINGLTGTNPLAGRTLEIGTSTLYVNYAGATDPISLIRQYLAAGYNNGAWNGTPTATVGIITSVAAQSNPARNTSIGYADSADGSGVNTTANTIELKYTLTGDANLSANVDGSDLQALLSRFNLSGSWDQGNFNYSGNVNSADLQALLSNFNTSLPAQAAPLAIAAVDAGASPVSAGTTDASSAAPRTLMPVIGVKPTSQAPLSHALPGHAPKRGRSKWK